MIGIQQLLINQLIFNLFGIHHHHSSLLNSSIKQVNCVGAVTPWASSAEVCRGPGGGYRMVAHPHPGTASELGPSVQWDSQITPGVDGVGAAAAAAAAAAASAAAAAAAAAAKVIGIQQLLTQTNFQSDWDSTIINKPDLTVYATNTNLNSLSTNSILSINHVHLRSTSLLDNLFFLIYIIVVLVHYHHY